MHTFKLTPKPQSDFRLEVDEIHKECKLEKYGYRHNKIVYGFCERLPDLEDLQSLGLNIEEIPFDQAQLDLTNYLVERGRAKSKLEHLAADQQSGAKNQSEEAVTQQKLVDLNNKIQTAKEALGITGLLKLLKL